MIFCSRCPAVVEHITALLLHHEQEHGPAAELTRAGMQRAAAVRRKNRPMCPQCGGTPLRDKWGTWCNRCQLEVAS